MERTIAFTYGPHEGQIFIKTEARDAYHDGDHAKMRIVVDDKLVRDYADQFGDRNPIHLDQAAGQASIFKSRIAHGMLSFNFFSTLLGAGFPGPGTIFTGIQDWRFTAPVKIGDELSIEIKIVSARQKSSGAFDLNLEAFAAKADGTKVMSGHLTVIAPKI
ncbi:MAG: hypothetical protein HC883_05090 [Bdellovibrionaceae bacterium]|nr:hypothetical protein [Pseudobdellovibrionaceae bacterium]